MDYKKIENAVDLLQKVVEMSHYVSKERFDLAARVKFDLEDPKRLDRLYGLFNTACQSIHLFGREDMRQDLMLALDIAEAAYISEDVLYKHVPTVKDNNYQQKDIRRYFYKVKDDKTVHEIDVNLSDAQNLILLAELVRRPEVSLLSVVSCLGDLESRLTDKKILYFDGDIVFVYGSPTDRIFYDWYRSDAGVYLATKEGWRKLQYVRGRGYLNKEGEPEFENEKKYTNYKIHDSGRTFRHVGNIHKDASVLIDNPDKQKDDAD